MCRRCVLSLAQLDGKAACASQCTVEKLESNEETVEEFYCLGLLFSWPLETAKYFVMPNGYLLAAVFKQCSVSGIVLFVWKVKSSISLWF